MSEKKINTEKLIDSFWDLSNDPEILDDMLRSEGYDPDRVEKTGISRIKKLLFQQEVAMKKEKMANLYSMAIERLQVATAETKEAFLALLRTKAPSLQFRNLENLDEENIKQILNETEILDLMDKLEKGEF